MLEKLIQAWEEARTSAEKIVETKTEEGGLKQTFLLKFLDHEIEMHVTYKAKEGTSDEFDVDHPDIRLFVRKTGKIISFMTNSDTPATEFIMCIMNACNEKSDEEEKQIKERNESQKDLVRNRIMDVWRIRLSKTDAYTDNEIESFIEYAIALYDKNNALKNRCDRFIDVVTGLAKDITSKEVAIQSKGNHDILMRDMLYNIICKCVARMKENQYGDTVVPFMFMQNNFLNDLDHPSPEYVKKTREVMKNIYLKCDEKQTVFAFTISGLAQYYTLVTGETVEYRLAFLKNRSEKRSRFYENNNNNSSDANHKSRPPHTPFVAKDTPTTAVSYNTAFEQALANAKRLK